MQPLTGLGFKRGTFLCLCQTARGRTALATISNFVDRLELWNNWLITDATLLYENKLMKPSFDLPSRLDDTFAAAANSIGMNFYSETIGLCQQY